MIILNSGSRWRIARFLKASIMVCWVVVAYVSPVSAITLSLEPVGGVENTIVLAPGETFEIEVKVWGWEGELLRAIHTELDPAGFDDGQGNMLSYSSNCGEVACIWCGVAACSNCYPIWVDSCRRRCGGIGGDICDPGNPLTCDVNILSDPP